MRQRIHEILLVSSHYDSFILARDGQLSELILSEFVGLNLYQAPVITHAADANQALKMIRDDARYDLVITTTHIGDMHVTDFGKELRSSGIEVPLVLLTYESRELLDLVRKTDPNIFSRVFLWQGDY